MKYKVSLECAISATVEVEVEAENEEDARDKAEAKAPHSLHRWSLNSIEDASINAYAVEEITSECHNQN